MKNEKMRNLEAWKCFEQGQDPFIELLPCGLSGTEANLLLTKRWGEFHCGGIKCDYTMIEPYLEEIPPETLDRLQIDFPNTD
jgi:hypothetical protein